MHTAPSESFLQSKQDKPHFVRELCVVLQRKMEFLEGSDGTYLNLQVDNGTKVPCKIYQCKGDLFDRCISCDSIPEALYRLMCAHKVCEDCLYAGETHVCRACSLKTTTEKSEARRRRAVTGRPHSQLLSRCLVRWRDAGGGYELIRS
ncbi:hypothetical protein V5799_028039 [Amblyomma americanum]|uniref:RING-type domain-containing protein n=1 Tax=Amblyomma americanum TaxID=6943 RepID=A0AAQ4DE02_AMBAM